MNRTERDKLRKLVNGLMNKKTYVGYCKYKSVTYAMVIQEFMDELPAEYRDCCSVQKALFRAGFQPRQSRNGYWYLQSVAESYKVYEETPRLSKSAREEALALP